MIAEGGNAGADAADGRELALRIVSEAVRLHCARQLRWGAQACAARAALVDLLDRIGAEVEALPDRWDDGDQPDDLKSMVSAAWPRRAPPALVSRLAEEVDDV